MDLFGRDDNIWPRLGGMVIPNMDILRGLNPLKVGATGCATTVQSTWCLFLTKAMVRPPKSHRMGPSDSSH
jgi:hypothetical protein